MKYELSRPIKIEHVDRKGNKESITASTDEMSELANRMSLVSISDLQADLTVKQMKDRVTYRVTGDLHANIVQKSVVSGDDIKKNITHEIDAWFVNSDRVASFAKEKKRMDDEYSRQDIEMKDECDEPEVIKGGIIDVGEVVSQFLGLALDDYPRTKEEGVGSGDYIEKSAKDAKPNPFAILSELKTKK